MTRQEIINKLKEVADEIVCVDDDELTYDAGKFAFCAIYTAIGFLKGIQK